jgi:hypothetical protein
MLPHVPVFLSMRVVKEVEGVLNPEVHHLRGINYVHDFPLHFESHIAIAVGIDFKGGDPAKKELDWELRTALRNCLRHPAHATDARKKVQKVQRIIVSKPDLDRLQLCARAPVASVRSVCSHDLYDRGSG